jgi:hypothetical protein
MLYLQVQPKKVLIQPVEQQPVEPVEQQPVEQQPVEPVEQQPVEQQPVEQLLLVQDAKVSLACFTLVTRHYGCCWWC